MYSIISSNSVPLFKKSGDKNMTSEQEFINACEREAKWRVKTKMSNLTLMQHQHEIAKELGYKDWSHLKLANNK